MPQFHTVTPHLHLFEDTCNVYVLRHEDRALLIDCQCFGGLGGSSPMIAFLVDATVVVLGVFVFRGSCRRVES